MILSSTNDILVIRKLFTIQQAINQIPLEHTIYTEPVTYKSDLAIHLSGIRFMKDVYFYGRENILDDLIVNGKTNFMPGSKIKGKK